MGFYDNNRHVGLGSNIEFDLLEGYCGAAGAAMAALEGQQNDMFIFESAIASDFQEAMAIKEGADIEPLQEASLKGMFDAIINFLKKLGDKIKSLFTAFIAKMESYMKKDTKAFVDKYRVQINKKANFDKMKAKFSNPLKNGYVWDTDPEIKVGYADAVKNYNKDNFDMEDEVDRILTNALGNHSTTKKEFQKDLHDLLYDTEEIKDDWDLNDITAVMTRLTAADKNISNLKSRNESLQSQIKKTIDQISKDQTNVAKLKGNEETGRRWGYDIKRDPDSNDKKFIDTNNKNTISTKVGDQQDTQKLLAYMQQQANAAQTAILTYCSGVMAEAKWGLAQDRRIFAQAVGYTPKNESALLAEAMGDVAQWECESYFEDAEVLGA